MKCSPEFGPDDCSKTAIIQRALYGQKSDGAADCRHFASCLQYLVYESCKADPDIWMRSVVKADRSEIYEYILVYVDDLLIIGIKLNKMLAQIDRYFDIKDGLQGKPELYLGVKLKEVHLDDSKICWGMSSAKYVQEALKNAKMWMNKHGYKFSKFDKPMLMSYRPELDVLEQLDDKKALWYMSAIGIFCWAVELGRINICMET